MSGTDFRRFDGMQQVYSAQYRYHLHSPGPCSEDGIIKCEQWVLHISDHTTLEAEPERPEVRFDWLNGIRTYTEAVECCCLSCRMP